MFALTEELFGEFKEILPGHLLLGKREHLKRDMKGQVKRQAGMPVLTGQISRDMK